LAEIRIALNGYVYKRKLRKSSSDSADVLPVQLPANRAAQYFTWEVEARGIEPLSSSLSAQTSTCLAGENF